MWPIGAVVEIKSDVEEVYNFFVDFDCDIEAMLLEYKANVILDPFVPSGRGV